MVWVVFRGDLPFPLGSSSSSAMSIRERAREASSADRGTAVRRCDQVTGHESGVKVTSPRSSITGHQSRAKHMDRNYGKTGEFIRGGGLIASVSQRQVRCRCMGRPSAPPA